MGDIGIVSCSVGNYDSDDCYTRPGVLMLDPQPRVGEHPRLTAKRAKMLQTMPEGEWDYLIWIDGSVHLKIDPFLFGCELSRHCGDAALAVWAHPDRFDIRAEAEDSFAANGPKYDGQPLYEQVLNYRNQGLPVPSGLYAATVVCWNMTHPLIRKIADAWYSQQEKWSIQDQLSLPFVLWAYDTKPALLPYGLRDNPWITHHAHLRND